MSLGIVFKGPEGVVLAADSRVTLNAEIKHPNGNVVLLPSTYDNATKLLRVTGQDYIGVVTFGLGAIGASEPRSAHSFIPEFEAELARDEDGRLTVKEFTNRLSNFFMRQWDSSGMPKPSEYKGDPMFFVVAGYDEGEAYGRVFEIAIPVRPAASEQISKDFGAIWGGQREFVDRLMQGYDSRLPSILQGHLNIDQKQVETTAQVLRQNLSIQIPYQFLPLQDCVDLSIFLIRATINLQQWMIGVRGVGGAIDVATITKTEGFQFVQQKQITGERT